MPQSEDRKKMLTRRGLLAAAGLAVVGGVAARIAWVNENRVVIPEEFYGPDEWVELGDAYLSSRDAIAPGYAFRVNGAKIMSINEYLDEFAIDGSASESPDADNPCLLAVNMSIRNKGNIDGGLKAFMWRIVPVAAPETAYMFNSSLFSAVVPEIGNMGQFGVESGKTSTQTFPFLIDRKRGYFESGFYEEQTTPWEPIRGTRFQFPITDLPVRKIIEFDAT